MIVEIKVQDEKMNLFFTFLPFFKIVFHAEIILVSSGFMKFLSYLLFSVESLDNILM